MLEPTLDVPIHKEIVPLAGRGGQGHVVSIIDIKIHYNYGNFEYDEHQVMVHQ